MKPITRELLAGASASVFLVGLSAIGNLPFLLALGLSAAVYFGVRMALPAPAVEMVADGITKHELEEAVKEIRLKAARFDHFGDRHKNPMRKRLRHIAQLVRDMIGHLKRDPTNLALATEFLDLQLPKALRIVETFTVLKEQKHLDASARRRLEDAEQTITMIEKAFAAQHSRMLESDVMAFEVDRRVYEELLRLDGEIDLWQGDDRVGQPAESDGSPPPTPRS